MGTKKVKKNEVDHEDIDIDRIYDMMANKTPGASIHQIEGAKFDLK